MKEALGSSESSFLTRATSVTSQKTPFFIVTAVKISNLTRCPVFGVSEPAAMTSCLVFSVS
jgi:hypothetical protein